MPHIETPCIKVCVVDPAGKFCLGCGRSLIEIERWPSLSEDDRRHILAELPTRMAARDRIR